MFDRLIESDTAGAEFKSRRRYFLVSSVVVGALFISAVVFSIYASEIGLGSDQFEVAAILAPVEIDATQPEPPRATQNRITDRTADVPQRPTNTQRIEESPSESPQISTQPNNVSTRPNMPFQIGEFKDPPSGGDYRADEPSGTGTGSLVPKTEDSNQASVTNKDETDPPPLIKRTAPKHVGIVNRMATSLPRPPSPPAALAMHVEGKVDIQVTIDESGNVISAKAASGSPFLRTAAENAAWKARFTPTILDGTPVKVTGMIVYNFTRN